MVAPVDSAMFSKMVDANSTGCWLTKPICGAGTSGGEKKQGLLGAGQELNQSGWAARKRPHLAGPPLWTVHSLWARPWRRVLLCVSSPD